MYSFTREPEPHYLPPDWSSHVQPEGQLYFYNHKTRVVTEAYLHQLENLQRVSQWSTIIESLIQSRNIVLPQTSELFIELGNEECDGCKYYFIDHESRTEFWIQEIDSEAMGFPATTSTTQLRWALEEHYWNHVEFFPSHIQGIPLCTARELTSTLNHAHADHLTSTVATFPYNAKLCSRFIDAIHRDISRLPESGSVTDRNTICIIARLSAQVAHQRLINFYGEECARLSRDQQVLDLSPNQKTPMYMSLLSKVLFGEPETYKKALESLWVDELAYSDPWAKFISSCQQEWKESAVATLGLLLVNTLYLNSPNGSRVVALAAIVVSATGLLTALTLVNRHRVIFDSDAAQAALMLDQSNHPTMGFRPLATVYSLPKALLFWSTILLSLQICITASRLTNCYFALGLAIVLFACSWATMSVLKKGLSAPSDDIEEAVSTVETPRRPQRWWRKFISVTASPEADLEKEPMLQTSFSP